ncbi:Uncharacterised protein [Mycobacteroides abscessus]|nr:Uncharacterised protein [Mycobacteroides abscessus]CPS46258.1 Uncharacterised protein [Mycobacteroides abscessus]CPY90775.1 Uncharacterised protein [Mycobacteroides abscessus]CPY91711.1 Uncharacterised protein [Mycobacteroides abscessus]SLJ23341.1 Uncharacterised protein [Mycobacteroides abscessus subsp. abscessus]
MSDASGPSTGLRTVAAAIKSYVNDLSPVVAPELDEWLAELEIPQGWDAVSLPHEPRPSRLTVCGARPEGGYLATETLSLFHFTGVAPRRIVARSADRWLVDAGAESVATFSLIPPTVDVEAVRCTGFMTVDSRRVWVQSSIYVAGSTTSGRGILIEQMFVVESGYRARIRDDIADLGDAVQERFINRYTSIRI